jgi:hypothetical protein
MAKLGIDLDGVLYNWGSAAIDVFLNEDLPEPLDEVQRMRLQGPAEGWSHFEDVVGKANWDWFWKRGNELNIFLRGEAYHDNVDVTRKLAETHDVYLITSRPPRYSHQTFEWLGDQELRARGVLHYSNKAKLASALDLRVLVDDNPELLSTFLLKARGSLKGAFIYGQARPWNRGLVPTSYYRFRWVDDLTELLDDESRWAA